MKNQSMFHGLLILMLAGCAGLAQQSRLENFSETTDAYEQALLIADYYLAAKYINPLKIDQTPDLKKYKNIKIVEYQITHVNVSTDQMEIKQEVKIQYFLLNSNRLRTSHDSQIWHYQPKHKAWFLETGLPVF